MSVAVDSGSQSLHVQRKLSETDYEEILKKNVTEGNEVEIKEKVQAILDYGSVLFQEKKADRLADLITEVRPFLALVSRAKAARVVRALVDQFLDLESGTGREIQLCRECIEWANNEKRRFLRQALEARLMALLYENEHYEEALRLGGQLLVELKKLDDKVLLVEVQLLESQVYYRLGNLQRSRAALTSARTTANGIYCPPKLQAALDLASGVLHCADEREFKTAYSYFYEAFEGYDSVNSSRAVLALRYMLLAKIMMNAADEINAVLTSKLGLRYSGHEIDALREVGRAASERSLADFLRLKEQHSEHLDRDPVIAKHLNSFYHTLLGRNLLKLIEPYSRVQIDHVARLINLPLPTVEKKLSQMILDKEINGILDQGSGVLVVMQERAEGKDYEPALESVQLLGTVVDWLFQKAKKLT